MITADDRWACRAVRTVSGIGTRHHALNFRVVHGYPIVRDALPMILDDVDIDVGLRAMAGRAGFQRRTVANPFCLRDGLAEGQLAAVQRVRAVCILALSRAAAEDLAGGGVDAQVQLRAAAK